jgi:hypothetical protein
MVHWILAADEKLNTDFAYPNVVHTTLSDTSIASTSEASPAHKVVLLIARNEEVQRSVIVWYS